MYGFESQEDSIARIERAAKYIAAYSKSSGLQELGLYS